MSETKTRKDMSTQKYIEYQTELCVNRLKTSFSAWRRYANSAMKILTDATLVDELRQARDNLEDRMSAIYTEHDRLTSEFKVSDPALNTKFEDIDTQHFELTRSLTDKIHELESNANDKKSHRTTSSIGHLSRLSSRSNAVETKIIETTAEAAALKAKLAFIDEENQKRCDFEKFQTKVKLCVAQAKLEAINMCTDGQSAHSVQEPLKYIPDGSHQYVQDYVSQMSGESDRKVEFEHVPLQVNPDPSPLKYDLPNSHKVDSQATSHKVDTNSNTNAEQLNLIRTLTEQVCVGRLPQPEPGIFSGNVLAYPAWNRAFDILIERRGIPEREKLYYLKKYVSGAAMEAIEGFFLISTDQAFEQAKLVLDERFGNPFTISYAFRDKIDNWPKISPRDGYALRKFADFLKQCETAMNNCVSLKILNDESENRKMLGKLPDWMVQRWGRYVVDQRRQHGTFPPFYHFVDFVANEAEIMCDPITSLTVRKPESVQTGKRNPMSFANRQRSTFTSNSSVETRQMEKELRPTSESCLFCTKLHHLENCETLMSKPMRERKQFLIDNELCFGCLKQGHRSRFCQNRLACKTCSKLHSTVLHGDLPIPKRPVGTSINGVSHLSGSDSYDKCSMILPVMVSSTDDPNNEQLTYALLDTQSDTSFVHQELCDRLNVTGQGVKLSLSTITSCNETVQSRRIDSLQVRGVDRSVRIKIPLAYTRDDIPANIDHIPTPDKIQMWPHLRPLEEKLSPLYDAKVELLIGYNCPQALVPRDVMASENSCDPFGQLSDLGWGVVGAIKHAEIKETDAIGISHRAMTYVLPQGLQPPNEVYFSQKSTVKEQLALEKTIHALEMDFHEVSVSDENVSYEDKCFLTQMKEGIHISEGHYEMPLPFREKAPELPDNKSVALNRLSSLVTRFKGKDKFRDDYIIFMSNIISSGHAEVVPLYDLSRSDGKKWYLPHHGVYHNKKPDKIRVVFDCASKFDDVSLNDCLLKGPDLTNNLLGVLCRFRMEHVAFMCDVKQMFHQFFVNPEHRDYLRFLWWRNSDYNDEVTEYRMKVHLFGAVSSPGCANYGLKQTVEDQEASPQTTNFIRNNFYVDDGLCSVPTAEEALNLIQECKEVCANRGLKLHKFISNSKQVMEAIPSDERTNSAQDLDLSCEVLPSERALGVQWCADTDSFQFKIDITTTDLVTRRSILSTVSSIYDPIGFLSPVILRGKKILQQLCMDKYGWDTPVSGNILDSWNRWKSELISLSKLNIPRCVKPDDFGRIVSVELHHFADGSTLGYGQCSYLRLVNDNQQVHCCFLLGKSRVTPMRPITVPRIELQAAVLSVKVGQFVKNQLKLDNATETYWTDSRIVLGYISNEARRFHVYVANRVQQIRDRSTPNQWHHVKSSQNPADEASRGLTADHLTKSKWLNGPDFLWEKTLPSSDNADYFVSAEDPEVRKSTVLTADSEEQCQSHSILSRLEYFSDWYRARRAIANCVKLKSCLKRESSGITPIQTEDLKQAELLIIKLVQAEVFPQEIKRLKSLTNPLLKSRSVLRRLDPFLDDDGILRVGGRLRQIQTTDAMKFPAILPKRHHITRLILRCCHEKVRHQGKGMTINEIRANGYWIIGCGSCVSYYIAKCVQCRKLRASVQNQKMSDLPSDRGEECPPFTYCAVDCFGPFHIREGRKELKRYGVLFTCMNCRAIHLESASSLSTDSFINALRRFISIRGPIRQLRCDRGTNFVGAKNEFETLNQDQVKSFLLERNCDFFEFRFNPPYASHMGGVWERLIRTTRNVMSALFCDFGLHLDDESLRTVMCEAAAIVNSRPLTVDTLHDPRSLKPLTPNHLLTLKSQVILPPPGNFSDADVYSRKRWRCVQHISNEFWHRWRKEFLSSQQSRQKWTSPKRNMEINDIVILKDDNMPRNTWHLARVSEIYPGHDGLVRKVQLAIPVDSSDAKGSAYSFVVRPIHKLVLILENSHND